ncbi:MAG: zf-TFIIB domain-containing protein [Planctomycetota bacterium]
MRCPIHPNTSLEPQTIEPGIEVMTCPKCQGIWMSMAAYWDWRKTLKDPLPNLQAERGGSDVALVDSEAGKRCPFDGAFLIRHQVGHGIDFHVDRCGRCGGIWLDAGEWETLRTRQMHDDLHLIFTSSWQAEVRRQRRAKADEQLLLDRLGQADYRRAVETKNWIDGSTESELLYAFFEGLFEVGSNAVDDLFG